MGLFVDFGLIGVFACVGCLLVLIVVVLDYMVVVVLRFCVWIAVEEFLVVGYILAVTW